MIRLEKIYKGETQMKKNSGITLIALAVTIIILIIIASVGTYSGIKTLRDANEKVQISEIGIVQQAVVENYAKYLVTKQTQYLRGTEVSYAEVQKLVNEINSKNRTEDLVVLKGTSGTTDITDYYYELSAENLDQMKIFKDQVSEEETSNRDTYIVNYKTGEVINKSLKVTYTGIPLYTYSIDE